MTQTTDDPAIPQQGPVVLLLAALDADLSAIPDAVAIDTAFAALESALRTSNHLDDGNGGCGAGKNPVWPCTCGRDAALALAEGVRS